MLNTFKTSFKLNLAYTVNSTLYGIKQLPILKKILKDDLYKSEGLKAVAGILGILLAIGNHVLKKLLYFGILMFLPTLLFKVDSANAFIHIYVFLTIIGFFINDLISIPTRDKYYSIIIMKMNPKEFAITEYITQIVIQILAFIPFLLIFGFLNDLPLYMVPLLLLFLAEIKLMSALYNIIIFDKTKKFKSQTIYCKLELYITPVIFIICYGLLALNISINIPIFLIILLISTILGIISAIKIYNYKDYPKFYKNILKIEYIRAGEVTTEENTQIKLAQESVEYTEVKESNKKGFAYFHDLFVSRHHKLLTKPVKMQCIVISIIILVALIVTSFVSETADSINNMIMTCLPYFVFIMYAINVGKPLTSAMFTNCDHSMLTYSFYKTPKVILGVFKERLKTLIFYNILPAILIGAGLSLLLFTTGGTDNNLNYIIVIVSIISMSIFFSVHYLVMYYFLQPYNANTEVKSTTYGIVQSITYIVSYFMIELKLPTFYFGIVITLFCIIYSVASLILAYFIAPKTFKLRQ